MSYVHNTYKYFEKNDRTESPPYLNFLSASMYSFTILFFISYFIIINKIRRKFRRINNYITCLGYLAVESCFLILICPYILYITSKYQYNIHTKCQFKNVLLSLIIVTVLTYNWYILRIYVYFHIFKELKEL